MVFYSRFDLIFILFDKPDEEMDHKLSKRMMAIHTGKLRKSKNSLKLTETGPKPSGSIFDDFDCTDYIPLTERLNYQKEEEFEPIPPALLQKFIVYARSNIIPKISPEAADVLKNFYTELRLHGNNFDCIPITTLHLESLVRLTEARARAELRDVATEEDAYDVIDVVKHSMMNLYSDGMGGVRHTAQRGAGLSQRNQVRALIAELTRISEIRASAIFSIDEIREVTEKIGIPHVKFEDVMFSLNNQCYLIKKGPMLFQLQNFTCL